MKNRQLINHKNIFEIKFIFIKINDAIEYFCHIIDNIRLHIRILFIAHNFLGASKTPSKIYHLLNLSYNIQITQILHLYLII